MGDNHGCLMLTLSTLSKVDHTRRKKANCVVLKIFLSEKSNTKPLESASKIISVNCAVLGHAPTLSWWRASVDFCHIFVNFCIWHIVCDKMLYCIYLFCKLTIFSSLNHLDETYLCQKKSIFPNTSTEKYVVW